LSNKHHIIGLCGFAEVGKDTVGDLLETHAGFRKIAFADALRGEICDGFHVEPLIFSDRVTKQQPMAELAFTRCRNDGYIGAALRHLEEIKPPGSILSISEELVKPRTPRETMQLWGTQYRRAQDADYWVRLARSTIAYCVREYHCNVVLTDVRYANEAAMVRVLGGEIWQVTRPDRAGELEGGHSSAAAGSEYSPERIINNRHDMRHLQQLVLGAFFSRAASLPITVEIAA
jgi:hypothetical protein